MKLIGCKFIVVSIEDYYGLVQRRPVRLSVYFDEDRLKESIPKTRAALKATWKTGKKYTSKLCDGGIVVTVERRIDETGFRSSFRIDAWRLVQYAATRRAVWNAARRPGVHQSIAGLGSITVRATRDKRKGGR